MSKSSKYIAFIDLLGTTEFALEDETKFYNRLIAFQDTIADYAHILAGEGKVYFFSDSAYIESSNLDKLVKYLRNVRKTFFEFGLYIKGAIGRGQLNATDPHKSKLIKDRDELKIRKETVIGHCFGEAVVPIYALQAGLKGIGIRISDDLKKEFVQRGFSIGSCYLPVENNRRAECFNDLRLENSELDDGVLDLFLKNFYISNAKSRKYGRYYLPLLISWINSTDFSETELSNAVDEQSQASIPRIFEILLIRDAFAKHFADLVGLEYIYFALLNKIFTECDSERVKKSVFEYISKRRKFVGRLGSLPPCVMSNESRKQFLEKLSTKVAITTS